MSRTRLVAVSLVALAGLAAGGALTALAAGRGSAQPATNVVTLKEMRITPARATVPSGRVTFVARNAGTIEHELVVIRATRPLEVRKFRAVEPEGASPGEVEDVAPGTSKSVTLTLKPGKYLLICNIVGHYQLGMSATITAR